ncbi:MAG: sugar transferase, partial [Acidimicrobiia bacterium]|nr:sugar transferase [Acidimicrobiia bacterium]
MADRAVGVGVSAVADTASLTGHQDQNPSDTRANLSVARVPGTYEHYVKPVVDRVGGFILTLLILPIVAVVVVAIRASMGGPALFTQQRVGKHGQPFTVYKFRTMLPDSRTIQAAYSGPDRRRVHKSHNDPRVTPLGDFLRKWSIDEIPQFWNVALGQMSLVGPRPELVEIVETKYEDWQHRRHVVKPGVTGIWQISDQRQGLMFEATAVDLEYLDQVSLATDLKILLL